jgi:hypothetical protein
MSASKKSSFADQFPTTRRRPQLACARSHVPSVSHRHSASMISSMSPSARVPARTPGQMAVTTNSSNEPYQRTNGDGRGFTAASSLTTRRCKARTAVIRICPWNLCHQTRSARCNGDRRHRSHHHSHRLERAPSHGSDFSAFALTQTFEENSHCESTQFRAIFGCCSGEVTFGIYAN